LNLLTIGINHQIAPLEIREKVALTPEVISDAMKDLRSYLNQDEENNPSEVAILSTCNRTEIYCAANDHHIHDQQIQEKTIDWLSAQRRMNKSELTPYIQTEISSAAVRHVFRVGCGLDSMVLGETQILGQMKQAVAQAQQAGSIGTYLNQLFNKTFAVAKEVRGTTEISTHAISMASAAVRLSHRVLGAIDQQRILFIGAGEMINLCAAHFSGKSPKQITIANRTFERGEELARMIRDQGHPCESIALSEVPQRLAQFDIVVSCTASSLPIIGLGMVNTALKNRRHQPMVMIDLAVPRDIEPEISKLRDVYLYTVDDLGKVVKEGMEYRTNAVKSAEEIINLQVKNFMHWLAQRSSVPFITSLKQRSEELQRVEIEKAKKRLNRGEDPADVMTELARGLANKFMHGSLHSLHHVDDDSVDDYQKVLTKIFMTESKRGGSC